MSIETNTGGEVALFKTRGEIKRVPGGYELKYRQEGEVMLTICPHSFLMQRSELFMKFCPQALTEAKVLFGGSYGGFQLFTKFYTFSDFSNGEAHILLDYELRFPKDVQKFSLKITIQLISEVL